MSRSGRLGRYDAGVGDRNPRRTNCSAIRVKYTHSSRDWCQTVTRRKSELSHSARHNEDSPYEAVPG
jgi:hypothetical protein